MVDLHRYLIIHSISKRANVEQLVVAANAFQFVPIVVGATILREYLQAKKRNEIVLEVKFFDTLLDAKVFLQEQGVPLIGLEIMGSSMSLNEFQWNLYPSIAIIPGNEGTGLSIKQKNICDGFLYIPQYGEGTASLNVNVATSIVMHSCCASA